MTPKFWGLTYIITLRYNANMDDKPTPPTNVRLNLADKKAIAVIKKILARPGEKMTTTAAIKTAIHDTAIRLQNEQTKS
jgi:hypothetical protein